MSNVQSKQSTKILIVGGGPTGLFASILLSKYQIPHVLIEERPSTLQAPAAHVVNTRTMEIFRQAGLDVNELYALNTHPRATLVSWNSRLENSAIGVFDMTGNREALMAQSRYSREHTTNISQHRLEAFLKRHAEKSEFAEICYATQWVGFCQGDNQKSKVFAADGSEFELSHDFVIAADGASSSVARALNIRKVGPDAIATLLNLTCEVDVSSVTGEECTLLHWLLEPSVQGTVIVHDPKALSVYMRPLATPYESIEDYDEARCDSLLKEVFGNQPYKIRHKGVWKMTAQVADSFRKGSVFLAGDAIHRFPPTGGLGLNTGVGDVHNLVWKLAAVLNNKLDSTTENALLDSYEIERRPVAQRNSDVSKRNNDKMVEVIVALGLDPSKARGLAKIMSSWIVKRLPSRLRIGVYKLLVRPARQILSKAEGDDDRGRGIRSRVAAAIANQEEHFSSMGLDLGYVYREGCAVSSESTLTPDSEVSRYVETTGVGARLPHRQLANGERLEDKLDYRAFTFLHGAETKLPALDTFGVGVNTVKLDPGVFQEVSSTDWILVRPDGHVMSSSLTKF